MKVTNIKCDDCGKPFEIEDFVWYCESCEKYLHYKCGVKKHINHDIIPLKYIALKKFEKIPISIYGAGSGGNNEAYDKEHFLSNLLPCQHALEELNNNLLVFKRLKTLLCKNCFLKEIKNSPDLEFDHYILNDKTIHRIQYDFHNSTNVELIFKGSKKSKKGEHIKIHVIIKNLKKNKIKDVLLSIHAFSETQPFKENETNFFWYTEQNHCNILIKEEISFDKIEKKSEENFAFDLKIPQNCEILAYELISPTIKYLNVEEKPLYVHSPFNIYFSLSYKNIFDKYYNIYIDKLTINLE
jgi:hypothetical protein